MSAFRRLASTAMTAVALVAVLVISAAPASAHATLVLIDPAPGSVLDTAPSAIHLTFDEPVEITQGGVSIVGPDGTALPDLRPGVDPANSAVLVVTLPASMVDGSYHVTWRILSLDGHAVQGFFAFAIGEATSPLGAAQSSSGGGPTLLGGGSRSVAVAGALSLAGLSAFPLLVLRPMRRRLTDLGPSLSREVCRKLIRPLLVAATLTVIGTLGMLVDTASTTGPLLEVALSTRTGHLLLLRVAAVIVTTALLTSGSSRAVLSGPRLFAGLAGVVIMLGTFSWSSHAAAAPVDRWAALGSDLLHLLSAGAWIGGLLGLALAGIPAALSVSGRDRELLGRCAAALFISFSVTAQVAMLVVVATGTYPALMQISALSDLGQTWWGMALTAKLALWMSLLIFAAANAFAFVPTLAARAAARARRLAALDQLRSAVRVELAIAGVLIVVAALMSATAQPTQVRRVEAAQGSFAVERTSTAKGSSRGYLASVNVVRSGIEPSTTTVFNVVLSTQATRASAPTAEAILKGPDGVRRSLALDLASEGQWVSPGVDVAPGRYDLKLRFDRADRPVIVPVQLTVPS